MSASDVLKSPRSQRRNLQGVEFVEVYVEILRTPLIVSLLCLRERAGAREFQYMSTYKFRRALADLWRANMHLLA